MFKGTVNNTTTITANTNIPLTVVYNTNSNTAYSSSNNTVIIRKSGFYDVKGQFVLTDVAAGDVSIQMYSNDTAIPEAIATATSTAATDFITLPLTDMFRVLPTPLPEFANLSFRVSDDATIDAGVVTVERVR